VIVYVADSIHSINIEVRSRKSPEKAREVALKLGDKIISEVKSLAESKFSTEDLSKIRYARWDELHTSEYQDKLVYFNKKYETDVNFKNHIIGLVDGFTKNKGRNFSQEDKVKLGSYVVAEFPEILTRTPINSWTLDAYAYPFDGALPEFIENIQKGVIFPEIKENVMDTEPKVFMEVRE